MKSLVLRALTLTLLFFCVIGIATVTARDVTMRSGPFAIYDDPDLGSNPGFNQVSNAIYPAEMELRSVSMTITGQVGQTITIPFSGSDPEVAGDLVLELLWWYSDIFQNQYLLYNGSLTIPIADSSQISASATFLAPEFVIIGTGPSTIFWDLFLELSMNASSTVVFGENNSFMGIGIAVVTL